MRSIPFKQFLGRNTFVQVLLIFLVLVLTVLPLYTARDADFEGADGLAQEAVLQISKDYEPWFLPIFEPKSGEIESMLFALQAAIGAGILGYGLGYLKGKYIKPKGQKS